MLSCRGPIFIYFDVVLHLARQQMSNPLSHLVLGLKSMMRPNPLQDLRVLAIECLRADVANS